MAVFKKLTIYLDENEYLGNQLLYKEVLEFLRDQGLKGATVFKGVFGWGPDGVVHTVNLLRAASSLPLKIEVIERAEILEKIIPRLKKMIPKGLITLAEVEVLFSSNGKL